MVTYKITKSYYNSDWNNQRCSAKHGCWAYKVKTVKVITSINCACCKSGHKEIHYLCDKHIENLTKYLPSSVTLELKINLLSDPIINGLFIKQK